LIEIYEDLALGELEVMSIIFLQASLFSGPVTSDSGFAKYKPTKYIYFTMDW